MSDGSYGKIRTEPLQNIGAQDLLSVGYNYYGFLRKKRRWDKLTGSSRWKQRFVVLSEGCLYCFSHESSSKPMAAFALCFYDNCHELFLKIPHCLEIKHEEPNRSSLIFSCESGERQKLWIAHIKDCIEQCGQLSASSLNLSDQSIDEGIVADKALERPFGRRSGAVPLPALPQDDSSAPAVPQRPKRYKETARSEYDLESEEEDDFDDGDIYDDIDEEDQTLAVAGAARTGQTLPSKVKVLPAQTLPISTRKPLPLPAKAQFLQGLDEMVGKKRPVSMGSRAPVPLPISASKPTSAKTPVPMPVPRPTPKAIPPSNYVPVPVPVSMPKQRKESSSDESEGDMPDYQNIFQSSDYLFDSNDREQAKGLLVGQTDGTFLIRKSRSSASQVLSVVANREVKEFQITENGQEMSIDKQKFFRSLDAMLNFYYTSDLPKSEYQVKLKKGYKAK